ncbi:MAG: type II toxin-antitoxin system HicB family antitoxin [Acidobacteriia bacterium]|nr:type II toxin-antitoxin system HicB family antitoxin [Terriglobia bacterium]
MRSFTYPATLKPDRKAGGFTVTFRDLPEAVTQGEDVADAVAQAADCIAEAIAGRIRLEESIPEPSRMRKGEYPIPVPALMAAKAAMFLAMKETGLTKVQLAKRLKCDEKEVRRMLDPRHNSRIDRIEGALEALGRQLIVGYRAA